MERVGGSSPRTRGSVRATASSRWRSARRVGAAAVVALGGAGGVAAGVLSSGALGGGSTATTHLLVARDTADPLATPPSGRGSVTATFSGSGGHVHASGTAGGVSASGGGKVGITTPSSIVPSASTLLVALPSASTLPSSHCVSTPGIPGASTAPITASGHFELTSLLGGGSVRASGTGLVICAG